MSYIQIQIGFKDKYDYPNWRDTWDGTYKGWADIIHWDAETIWLRFNQ